MATKRTLQLTHEQIDLITQALDFSWTKRLDLVKQNRKELGEDVTKAIVDKANEFSMLSCQINDGELDV